MAKPARQFWLMKSEPEVYSIADLQRDGTAPWDGVRNYQARNYMRDTMRPGDGVLFYHSNADPTGVAGLAEIRGAAYPDPSQFDPASRYHDPKASPDQPRWFLVEVGFVEAFAEVLPLAALRAEPALAEMLVLQRGQRLSVQPVEKRHFKKVLELAGAKLKVR